MKAIVRTFAAFAMSGLMIGCGGSKDSTRTSSIDGPTGSIRLALNGGNALMAATSNGSSPFATFVVQSVFDSSQSFVVDCQQKDHPLNGSAFCDELLVVPPGVYEVVVQTTDPNCRSDQKFYKIVVKEGQTTELSISLLCGQNNGGLDVIVTKDEVPEIKDIGFIFRENGEPANKFVCQRPDTGDVTATVTVFDSDNTCAELTEQWLVNGTATLTPPIILPTAKSGTDHTCFFSAVIDAASPVGVYNITLNVSDPDHHTGSITFPIHIIECP